MDMPRPSDAHRKLQALAGAWKAEEQIFPSPWDPKGGPALGKITARTDLDGFFLISDYVEERNGRISYRGHGVYGWDEKNQTYTMYWFDSMGGGGYSEPTRGTWEGNTLTFQNQTPIGHTRYVYAFESEGRYTFRIENSGDGREWKTFMEGRFVRV